jgi:hypothetical protein
VLNGEDTVHALQAQATLAIEKIGDVGLFEAGLLRKTEPGKVTFLNALPKGIAQIILQDFEFHS